MKALRVYEFGTPDLAVLEDVAIGDPGARQVAVRVEAAGVNPLDLKILAGSMQPVFPVSMPYTLGTDIAGVVEAVGPEVDRFKPGDRVVGRLDPTAGGGFAEYAVIAAQSLCPIPEDMSQEQAAALPTGAGTAWLALFGVGQVRAGQRVLIHAAAGGVGSFAVQFAKQAGAHVIATASSKNHPLVRELGADEVLDYRHEDFAKRLQDLDMVLDTVGGETLERSWQVVRPGGTLVSTVDPGVQARGDIQARFVFFKHDAVLLNTILQVFQARQLQVVLDTVHPLDDARAALEQVASGHARGKVIIRASR
ncbi:NADP-dependent oxidoreductase [Aquabacterium sp. A7-Y]|uniref:NADP-dependent oxidoreductase n=1 Tax=Aquabacterium sp. A7-Y TaxID=1349605 RepID=UPI00223D1209|nr:NADP-dependent oxidoreductase [Aquabacterium sp. A7-Y]MCW7541282.1 NADP-dependent oxidoreductase [Aquabacterium sp. A7-Y]